ncbi:MAG: hypothetical protein IPN70_05140 [Candidatus Moraniibacteriota bacterium]|nr:MAG: hypothetical protein IPN70_05140 [Candidatus Moranbacteria bacterium]
MEIFVEKKYQFFIFLLLIKAIQFFLYYIRNSFLITASLFLFFIIALTIIFSQENLDENSLSAFVEKLPIEIPFSEQEEMSFDEKDLSLLFIQASLYLTIITEIFRNIARYFFKKEFHSTKEGLKKRIWFVIISTIILYSFAFAYLFTETPNDLLIMFFVLLFFWMICCGSAIIFLLLDHSISKFNEQSITIRTKDHERIQN